MLRHGVAAAEGALGLLADPVADALPAEDVAALGGGGVAQLLEAEGALALLVAADVGHEPRVGQVESWCAARGGRGVRCGREVQLRVLVAVTAAAGHEEGVVVGVGVVVAERDVHGPALEPDPLPLICSTATI